jgi:hypothetical protein
LNLRNIDSTIRPKASNLAGFVVALLPCPQKHHTTGHGKTTAIKNTTNPHSRSVKDYLRA